METEPAIQDPKQIVAFFTKNAALIGAAVYMTGFFTITQYQASFGIVQLSPLKPRILSAGLLYSSLVLVMSLVALAIYDSFPPNLPSQRLFFGRISIAADLYYFTLSISAILENYITGDKRRADFAAVPWQMQEIISVGLILFFGGMLYANKHFEKKPVRVTVFSLLALAALFLAEFRSHDPVFWIPFWLWLAGISALLLAKGFRDLSYPPLSPALAVLILLFPLVIFSTKVYPRIQSAWGGGYPNAAILHLQAPMPFSNKTDVEVLLIDETDYGYYSLIPGTGEKAVFIRRDAVKAITFINESK